VEDDTVPNETVSRDTVSEGTVSGGTVPGNAVPRDPVPNGQRGLATAHRVLAGVSGLAVLLAVLGSVGSVIDIISAPTGALRWATAVVLVLVGLCWLIAVLHSRSPGRTGTLGYLSAAMLTAGAALGGWNAAAAAPAPEPTAGPGAGPTAGPAARGTATIDSPRSGAEVGPCLVDVRFHGRPAPGKTFVVAAQSARLGYYFETDLTPSPGDVYTGRVQAGGKTLSTDEKYTVSVFEYAKEQVTYLVGVVTEVEDEATYWASRQPPPGSTASLDSVIVHRVRADPGCADCPPVPGRAPRPTTAAPPRKADLRDSRGDLGACCVRLIAGAR
jgi:hypothetical protein